jgi:SAM-dependent methyltransferase
MSAHRRVFPLLEPYVGSRVFEVGCGTGTLTGRLLERAELVFGIEPDETCRDALLGAVGSHPRFVFRPWRLQDCNVELLLSQAFNTVVCVSELEHIEDDASAMKLFGALVAAQAGRVVLLVPARLRGWNGSPLPPRYYTRRGLAALIERAGLTPRVIRYANLIGLLGWYCTLIFPSATRVEEVIGPPLGLSLLAVADSGGTARVPVTVASPRPVTAPG